MLQVYLLRSFLKYVFPLLSRKSLEIGIHVKVISMVTQQLVDLLLAWQYIGMIYPPVLVGIGPGASMNASGSAKEEFLDPVWICSGVGS